jgi:formate hydrogenlyase transcriptional activator
MNATSESDRFLEHLVFEIAQGVSGETGDAFFSSLVRHLARALQADYVLVGVLQPGGERVSTLAVHAHGKEAVPFEYALAGTPCANVTQQRVCSYPSGVQQLFPQDVLLTEMGADGYTGSPMIDSNGRCVGLICAVTMRPLANPKLAEALLQIFAARAETELERKNYEDALAHSQERLRGFVSHGVEAIIRVEFKLPVPLDLPVERQIELLYEHGYVADCNDQAAQLFGRTRAEELIGAPIEAISPRSDPEQAERIRVGIRTGWSFSQVERTLAGRNLLVTRKGIIEDGKLLAGWVTACDVTALKQAEAEVRRLNVELERRIEELTELKGRLEQDNAYLLDEIRADHHLGEMVGSSPRFRELTERIQLVASTSATVLICGETGTGKELVARVIHELSPRSQRPLVKVNCAAISANLVESELFGHVKGAFTGATERRTGRFEYANGGTLLLDEITEMPLEIQAKLLRILQEREFEPVGSNRTVKVDVRLIASTNRNLVDAVKEGRFRIDLYYRLMVVPVDVPPLRERREDIPALAAHFVARLSRQFGRRVEGISEGMMRQLIAYDWPGNVRELENLLARAIVLSPGGALAMPKFAAEVKALAEHPRSMGEAERRHIESVLVSTGWVLEGPKGAATTLHLNPSTLRSRMKRLGIQRPQSTA